MKITEMTTGNFADFVNASGDHIANILQHESVIALFSDTETKPPIRFMKEAASILFGSCRDDVFAVIGAMNGKTAKEIEDQNILVTFGQLRKVYNDIKAAEIPD